MSGKIIAIAASTGGVEAVEEVIARFPLTIPPVVLVIHMPPGFTKLFAARLDKKVAIKVKEAETGDLLKPGQILVAPSGKHMKLARKGSQLITECFVGPKVQFVIPSADVLFESVASIQQRNAIGVILTGMGADGADGMMMMRKNGAINIGQDKDSCTVYGMPKVAYERGAIHHVLPLGKIADKILTLL